MVDKGLRLPIELTSPGAVRLTVVLWARRILTQR